MVRLSENGAHGLWWASRGQISTYDLGNRIWRFQAAHLSLIAALDIKYRWPDSSARDLPLGTVIEGTIIRRALVGGPPSTIPK